MFQSARVLKGLASCVLAAGGLYLFPSGGRDPSGLAGGKCTAVPSKFTCPSQPGKTCTIANTTTKSTEEDGTVVKSGNTKSTCVNVKGCLTYARQPWKAGC